jgi:hypothetical protein
MMKQIKICEFLLYVNSTYLVTTTFDLWMSQSLHDTFTFIINFSISNWELKHVTIDLFEAKRTSVGLANQLQILF